MTDPRHLPHDGPTRHGWIVTEITRTDPHDPDRVVPDPHAPRLGAFGPASIPDEAEHRLANGEGRHWRTLYDADHDGDPAEHRVTHAGRYLHLDDGDELGEDAFSPLDDLAGPDVGAGEIQYREPNGTWSTL